MVAQFVNTSPSITSTSTMRFLVVGAEQTTRMVAAGIGRQHRAGARYKAQQPTPARQVNDRRRGRKARRAMSGRSATPAHTVTIINTTRCSRRRGRWESTPSARRPALQRSPRHTATNQHITPQVRRARVVAVARHVTNTVAAAAGTRRRVEGRGTVHHQNTSTTPAARYPR